MTNFLMKDLDLFETIENDAASKISGGAECTEETRAGVVGWLTGSLFITQAQADILLDPVRVPLVTFCAAVDDLVELAVIDAAL